jgi:hypothetical protein
MSKNSSSGGTLSSFQLICESVLQICSINIFANRINLKKSNVDFKEKEITSKVPDLYSLIGAKTLDAFDISVQNFEFDYIYRTNVSSYLDLAGLQHFVNDKPRENFYGGAIGNHQGIYFASGCGYFISRDLVIETLRKRALWDHNLIDDVALGKLLTRDLHVDIQEVKRIDLDSPEIDLDKINNNNRNIFHYRCKASNPDTTIQIMRALHKHYSNKGWEK